MMRKILVPVRGDGKGDNVFAHAVALARGFDAHLDVTHCRARPENLLPFGVPIPAALREQLLSNAVRVFDEEEAGLRQEVLDLAKHHNVKMSDTPTGNEVSASFSEEAGRQIDVIKHHGRLADLVAVAKPDIDRNLGANTLKSALFHTGRPVMMCPEPSGALPEILGKNITIAWDGSLEASRAVAMCLWLVRAAETVTILTASSKPMTVSPAEVQNYLEAHEVRAAVKVIDTKSNAAKALLAESKALGAELMIMGAYGDNQNYERVFGGVTQYVVDHADMPVILVN